MQIDNIILVADTGVIFFTVITELTSIAAFASVVAIPIGIVQTKASLFLSITNAISWKNLLLVNLKQKKTRIFS